MASKSGGVSGGRPTGDAIAAAEARTALLRSRVRPRLSQAELDAAAARDVALNRQIATRNNLRTTARRLDKLFPNSRIVTSGGLNNR